MSQFLFSKILYKFFHPYSFQFCSSKKEFLCLCIKKFFEPLFEIESRRNKKAFYLFEKQIYTLNTYNMQRFFLNIRYFIHVLRIKFASKYRKIKVAFWVSEIEKWNSFFSTYKAFEKDFHFEPVVFLSYFKTTQSDCSPKEHIDKCAEYFKSRKIKFIKVYDEEKNSHIPLKKFKPDIVFYQQPWNIHPCQSVFETSKFALTAYIPYCFYSLHSYYNYFLGFHGLLWKYFVETVFHKESCHNLYGAKNCVALGSGKIDNYKYLNNNINLWKTTGKKRIIYAPHHAFSDEDSHSSATFEKNGNFILELAKMHPETEWIMKPHPSFVDRLLKYNIMTKKEIDKFFRCWDEIGSIYTGGDYYELFQTSDCLITDCISFLAEYLPTKKPVLHLRKDIQKEEFNELLTKITDSYYKIYNNETLENTFNDVILNGNDCLKEKRIDNIKLLMIDDNITVGEKIKNYIKKELKIKE